MDRPSKGDEQADATEENVLQPLKRNTKKRLFGTAEEAAEEVPFETKSVPQGLKPPCRQNACGTAEAVPLSKTGFSAVCE
jgi:hypothetical protein